VTDASTDTTSLQVQLRHSQRKAAALKDLLADVGRADAAGGGGGDARGGGDGTAGVLLRALGLSAGDGGARGGGGGEDGSDSECADGRRRLAARAGRGRSAEGDVEALVANLGRILGR
jgi:hypothetical protein